MVNFQELVETIRSRGHSLAWIASQVSTEEVPVGTSTVAAIKNQEGREPRYNLGVKLVELERKTR